MAAYGQITSGYWSATLIGVLLLLAFIATTIVAVTRRYRAHRKDTAPEPAAGLAGPVPSDTSAPLGRCWVLIAEAVIVDQRLSGEIDAETYQARMTDLAWQAVVERRLQRNA